MPHHVLFALLHPWGRLPQFTFAALSMGLFIVAYVLWAMIAALPPAEPFGPPTYAFFAVLWMLFCIFTRRFRDLDSSGSWMLIVLIAGVTVVLARLDPTLLGIDLRDMGKLEFLYHHGMHLVEALVVAVFCYLVRANGVSGPNAFGPEFGDDWDREGPKLADEGPLAGATDGLRFAAKMQRDRKRGAVAIEQRPEAVERRRRSGNTTSGSDRRGSGFGQR